MSVHIKLDSCCCDQTFAFERLHLIQASTVRLLTLSSDMAKSHASTRSFKHRTHRSMRFLFLHSASF